MIKRRKLHRLDLRHETIRLLTEQRLGRAVGGSLGTSDPSNTASGNTCGPSTEEPSLVGQGCHRTL